MSPTIWLTSLLPHTFARFIALLGAENVSDVPLELFGERFHLTPTIGKLANVVAEVGPMKAMAEGILKGGQLGGRLTEVSWRYFGNGKRRNR